jgi:hypothetical protein
MVRLAVILAGLAWPPLVGAASAVPAKPGGWPLWARSNTAKGPTTAVNPAAAAFAITPTSEVRLNGRACAFGDVPDGAVITRIVVDPDTSAVLIVHFAATR